MSAEARSSIEKWQPCAGLFAALGDETRLSLVAILAKGKPLSIAQLTAETPLTRQAVTKHLRVLAHMGVVHHRRLGRRRLFRLDPQPFKDIKAYLDFVSGQWKPWLD